VPGLSEAPPIVIVVAVADNGIIGADGGMPWHLSGDLKRVKALTMGKPLIMGRRTYESIGKPLPGRKTIVLTSDRGFHVEGVIVARDFAGAVAAARQAALEMEADEIVAFGGRDIYALALPLARRIYKTEIHASPVGDTRFPDHDPSQWLEISREARQGLGDSEPPHDFVTLERLDQPLD
jgi:dihydrofolate reductase